MRVALVNDYDVVVRGLERMLADHPDLVEVVELDVRAPVSTPVDVALYDTFSMVQVDRENIDALLQNPNVGRVAVYTWNLQPHLVEAALRKGVAGYLSKSLGARELAEALVEVASGQQVVRPQADVGDRPDRLPVAGGDWPGREAGLSARQAEVVALITQGYSNAEIAERAQLTLNTVKSYIRLAYRQMGVTTRTQAVLWGIERGMLPDHGRGQRPTASAGSDATATDGEVS